jgi:hypothetical protein
MGIGLDVSCPASLWQIPSVTEEVRNSPSITGGLPFFDEDGTVVIVYGCEQFTSLSPTLSLSGERLIGTFYGARTWAGFKGRARLRKPNLLVTSLSCFS